METELQRLTREISKRMTRAMEIMHEQRPSDTVSTLINCGIHSGNKPDFCVSYFSDWNPETKQHNVHYQANSQPSLGDAAIKALERGNQACST